jgi:hypothetical protein
MRTILDFVELHLNTSPSVFLQNELEVRFGTKSAPISKIDFDSVITKLKSLNYICNNEQGIDILKVQPEFYDNTKKKTILSNVRVEISGLAYITRYCRNDSITDIINNIDNEVEKSLIFNAKNRVNVTGIGIIEPVNVPDYNLRISYQQEQTIGEKSQYGKKIIDGWDSNKKSFRLMNRVTFTHESFPFKIDLSVVKMSTHNEYSYKQAKLNKISETFEIEIELDNLKLQKYFKNKIDALKTTELFNKCITHVLSGLQQTNFPTSVTHNELIFNKYKSILKTDILKFAGPSSKTLQLSNLIKDVVGDKEHVSVCSDFSVTDKADGDRKLLFIVNKSIYMITSTLKLQYTGVILNNNSLDNTIFDGEHILHDKHGNYINLYAAFDMYYLKGNSIRHLPFISNDENDSRFQQLNKLFRTLPNSSKIRFEVKTFLFDNDINKSCLDIFNNTKEYETDGLIFTHRNFGVGAMSVLSESEFNKRHPPSKAAWNASFKWKPPEFNTIDFLIRTKKDSYGNDIIKTLLSESSSLTKDSNISYYKIIELYVGHNPNKDGYLNPTQDILDGNFSTMTTKHDYKPGLFYPSNPYPNYDTHICYIPLDSPTAHMKTETGLIFADSTIVEFKYNFKNTDHYRWVPIRVRYDKTYEFKIGKNNFGNAYQTANNNWQSIHNPVTKSILIDKNKMPTDDNNDDVYYKRQVGRNVKTATNNLRLFHNTIIKSALIQAAAPESNIKTLMDLAVGKCGDLSKWTDSKYTFVYGVDISKDNIENKQDGACVRYIEHHKRKKNVPNIILQHANSSKNIHNGDAMYTEKDRIIAQILFGYKTKIELKPELIGKLMNSYYGIADVGFDVTSCQFALHYFFKDTETLKGFLTNVSTCTKVGGYFIGGCFDGETIFNKLKDTKKISIHSTYNKLIWEVIRQYDKNTFNNTNESLGYAISVYQESINKYATEYLVNFNYFIDLMGQFGFALLTKEEAAIKKLPASIGYFSDLYTDNINMSKEEKAISFNNKYFIFQKKRVINVAVLKI